MPHIQKQLKGESIRFKFYFLHNTMTVSVRGFMTKEDVVGKISGDFKYIELPENYSYHISGVGEVPVGKLKLTKILQLEAKECNGLDPYASKTDIKNVKDIFQLQQEEKRKLFTERIHAAFILKTSLNEFGILQETQIAWLKSTYPNSVIKTGYDQGAKYYTITPKF